MKCGEKLEKLIYLERKLKGESTKSKITEFESRFAEKLSTEVDRIFQTKVLRKTKIEIETD